MTASVEIEEACHAKDLLPANTEMDARLAAWAQKRLEILDRYIPFSSQRDLAKSWAKSAEGFSPHDPMNQLHLQQNEFQIRKAGVDLDSLRLELQEFELVKTAMQTAQPENTSLVELKRAPNRPLPSLPLVPRSTIAAPPFAAVRTGSTESIPEPVDEHTSQNLNNLAANTIGSRLVLANRGTVGHLFTMTRDSMLEMPSTVIRQGQGFLLNFALTLKTGYSSAYYYGAGPIEYNSIYLSQLPFVALRSTRRVGNWFRADAAPFPGIHTHSFQWSTVPGSSWAYDDQFSRPWDFTPQFWSTGPFFPNLPGDNNLRITIGIRNQINSLLQNIRNFHIESIGVWEVAAVATIVDP